MEKFNIMDQLTFADYKDFMIMYTDFTPRKYLVDNKCKGSNEDDFDLVQVPITAHPNKVGSTYYVYFIDSDIKMYLRITDLQCTWGILNENDCSKLLSHNEQGDYSRQWEEYLKEIKPEIYKSVKRTLIQQRIDRLKQDKQMHDNQSQKLQTQIEGLESEMKIYGIK